MGDLTVTTKAKEISPSNIQCPILNTTNYTVWSMRMKVALKVHKVLDSIEPGTTNRDKSDMAKAFYSNCYLIL